MGRSLARRCLWADAGLNQFAVQCESAPPQSADMPDDSHLGGDGTLAEVALLPEKNVVTYVLK